MARKTVGKVSQMRRMGVSAANESVTDRFRWEARSSGDATDKWMQILNTNRKYKYNIQGVFLHWASTKKLKYGKPRLGKVAKK